MDFMETGMTIFHILLHDKSTKELISV